MYDCHSKKRRDLFIYLWNKDCIILVYLQMIYHLLFEYCPFKHILTCICSHVALYIHLGQTLFHEEDFNSTHPETRRQTTVTVVCNGRDCNGRVQTTARRSARQATPASRSVTPCDRIPLDPAVRRYNAMKRFGRKDVSSKMHGCVTADIRYLSYIYAWERTE